MSCWHPNHLWMTKSGSFFPLELSAKWFSKGAIYLNYDSKSTRAENLLKIFIYWLFISIPGFILNSIEYILLIRTLTALMNSSKCPEKFLYVNIRITARMCTKSTCQSAINKPMFASLQQGQPCPSLPQ